MALVLRDVHEVLQAPFRSAEILPCTSRISLVFHQNVAICQNFEDPVHIRITAYSVFMCAWMPEKLILASVSIYSIYSFTRMCEKGISRPIYIQSMCRGLGIYQMTFL